MSKKNVIKFSELTINKTTARGSGWISHEGKDYYFKPGAGSLESFSGELYRFALGPDVITEILPVIDESGRAVGTLSEKIKNGYEYTIASKKFVGISPLTPDVRLALKIGSLCAAMHVLDEQDSNFGNIFIRGNQEGSEISQLQFSLIDVDRSLGQAFVRTSKCITNPLEFNHSLLRLHPDIQSIAGGTMGELCKRPQFKAQAYFVYLTLSLLDESTIADLANAHYASDPDLCAYAQKQGEQYVGERLRDLLIQNADFAKWLTENQMEITSDLMAHVEKFNVYKRLGSEAEESKDFIPEQTVKSVVEDMCNKIEEKNSLAQGLNATGSMVQAKRMT